MPTRCPSDWPAPAHVRWLRRARAWLQPGRGGSSPRVACAAWGLILAASVSLPVAQATFREDRFRASVKRIGQAAPRLAEKFLRIYPPQSSELGKVEAVHRFFQNELDYDTDEHIWGQADYWASPVEFFSRARGDCEDYAMGKYVALLDAGVPPGKLRVMYVRATRRNGTLEPHMVLAYFPDGLGQEPLILDNIDPVIKPASQRKDLLPSFMFTLDGQIVDLPDRLAQARGTTPPWFSNRDSYIAKTLRDGFLN